MGACTGCQASKAGFWDLGSGTHAVDGAAITARQQPAAFIMPETGPTLVRGLS